jgi:type IV pilus assembly protein PilN
VRLLDEINNMVLPREIQLTKVSEQGQQLNIEGVGRDNIAVALFMKNLERSPYIASVNLLFSKQATVSNAKVYQFSLSCVKKRS